MTDELKEFVHERFRRTDGKLDQLIELSTGFALRLGSLEQQLAALRTDFAHLPKTSSVSSIASIASMRE